MDSTILLLAIFVGTVCGLPTTNLVTRRSFLPKKSTHLGIFGGNSTTIEKHPYQVAIMEVGTNYFICPGTIIGKEWTITSADCLYGITRDMVYILAGTDDGRNGTKVNVTELINHPNYGKVVFDYDISLLRLERPLNWTSKVSPAFIPKAPPKAGTQLQVSGWGKSDDNQTSSLKLILQDGYMSATTQQSCKKFINQHNLSYTNRMMCTYSKRGITTLCEGDWADPFITKGTKNGTSVYVVHGLFLGTIAAGFCSSDAGDLINVALHRVADWIHNATKVELY